MEHKCNLNGKGTKLKKIYWSVEVSETEWRDDSWITPGVFVVNKHAQLNDESSAISSIEFDPVASFLLHHLQCFSCPPFSSFISCLLSLLSFAFSLILQGLSNLGQSPSLQHVNMVLGTVLLGLMFQCYCTSGWWSYTRRPLLQQKPTRFTDLWWHQTRPWFVTVQLTSPWRAPHILQ